MKAFFMILLYLVVGQWAQGQVDSLKSEPPPLPPKPTVEIIDCMTIGGEEMPRFPGCEDLQISEERKKCSDQKLFEFVYRNLRYPALAREYEVQGIVTVSFVVNTDGSLSDGKIIEDIGEGCGEEVLRVIWLMNAKKIRWVPGKQRGRPVAVQYYLPVKFKLE